MARELNKLRPSTIKDLGPGLYNDGESLYLRVRENGTKSWVFRYRARGRNSLRDMGLGSVNTLSLPQARALARTYRVELLKGVDPIDTRRSAREKATQAAERRISFMECADAYIATHKVIWKNEKHRRQWRNSLEDYCGTWGALPVSAIDTEMVTKALEGRWQSHTETASRVRQRIERVLDWAKVRGYRDGDNPARWRGHLDKALPAPADVKDVTHRPALPYGEVPAFMKALTGLDTLSSKALTLQVLTAVRPGEATGARWEEFDLTSNVWTIPKVRMKSKKHHMIPLPPQAQALLKSLPRVPTEQHLFPGVKGKPLTTAATMKLLRSLRPDMTCHGFRSSFRDWAAEQTNYAGAVAEFALAHGVKDQTIAAYLRTTYFDKRKDLMAEWADYCYSKKRSTSTTRRKRA